MAKKQKKKKNIKSAYERERDIVWEAVNAQRTAVSRGSLADAYKRFFRIPDELFIRDFESRLTEDEVAGIRGFFFSFTPLSLDKDTPQLTTMQNCLAFDQQTTKNTLEANCVSFLADIFRKRNPSDSFLDEEVMDCDAQIWDFLPIKWLNESSGFTRFANRTSQNYSNVVEQSIKNNINWEFFFRGKTVNDWARDFMKLVERVSDQEELQSIERQRQKTIISFINLVIKHFETAKQQVLRNLQKEGAPKELLPPACLPQPILLAKPTPIAAPFQIPERQDDMQKTRPLTRAIERKCGIQLSENNFTESALTFKLTYRHLLQIMLQTNEFSQTCAADADMECDAGILTYTLLYYLSQYKTPGDTPLFLHTLFTVLLLRSSSQSDGNREIITSNHTPLVFNTAKQFPLSKKIIEKIQKEHENYLVFPSINLAQVIFQQTHVIVPHTLKISLEWSDFFKALGFTEQETFAMCGYLTATRELENHATLTELDMAYLGGTINEEKETLQLDSVPIAMLPDALKTILLPANNQEKKEQPSKKEDDVPHDNSLALSNLETKINQLEREHRKMTHRAESAESKIAEMREENERLLGQIKHLLSQQDALQETIMEISSSVPESSEAASLQDDNLNAETDYQSIGKDVKITVYGGPQNWITEQQKRFPCLTFVGPDEKPNENQVAYSDIVILNTHVMNHKFFWVIQNVCKNKGKQMYFIDHPGINKSSNKIVEIYRQYCEERANDSSF